MAMRRALAMRRAVFAGTLVLAAIGCDPRPGPSGEPPPVVEAVPVEPEPPQTWPPQTEAAADSSAKSTTAADAPVAERSADTSFADTSVADEATSAKATSPEVRAWTEIEFDRQLSASARVRQAKANKTEEVRALFDAAGVEYPSGQLLFRVFKRERELEVWASASTRGALTHITTYAICAASGKAGPKKREGDWQVPEGFYKIDVFNSHSKYHLAMRVGYPNARDREQRSTGGQIMIHGDCVSVGCIALGDERIEELWVMASALRSGRPHVHLFPARDLEAAIAAASDPMLARFWEGLLAVERAFAEEHVIPRIEWNDDGVYRPKGQGPGP